MTSVTLDRTPSRVEPESGEPTLDEVLAGVWEGLTAHRLVECPVCSAAMAPEYAAGALPIGGRCSSCGATLR